MAADLAHAYIPHRTGQKDGLGNYAISGRAFLRHYAINTELSRRWEARLQSDVLCVDLKLPGVVVTGNRGPRHPA